MKIEGKQTTLDSELERLWKEGIQEDTAGKYMAAIKEAGNVQAGFALRAKILESTMNPKQQVFKLFRVIPLLAPALILIWVTSTHLESPHGALPAESAASDEDDYVEIASLMDQFMIEDSIVDELEPAWIFF